MAATSESHHQWSTFAGTGNTHTASRSSGHKMLRYIAEFLREMGKPKRQTAFRCLLLSISSSRQWMPYCRDWHCNTMTSHTRAPLLNYVKKRARSGSRGISVGCSALSGAHTHTQPLRTRNKMCTAHPKSRS